MRILCRFTLLTALLSAIHCSQPAYAQTYPQAVDRALRAGGYVYAPPTVWAVPPPVAPYYVAPYGYGYGAYYRPMAPYGFGSPYYSGYNDPYYYGYGPGTREFLRFGGADFYGW
jgi:hypothetical protein